MSKSDHDKHFAYERVLFSGAACYPQSPSEKTLSVAQQQGGIAVTKNDQLVKIMNLLAEEQPMLEKEFFDQTEMYSYYKGTYKYSKSQSKADWKSLEEMHKDSDPLLLDLLRDCLMINPEKRLDIEDCLSKPVFFEMRD